MQLMTKQHALDKIAQNGSLPMTKQPLPTEAPDDRTKGKLFAQEVIALVVGQVSPWNELTHRAFKMTVEARKVTLESLDKWLKHKREEYAEQRDVSDKDARGSINSASTQISYMRTILNGMNAGMTYETCAAFHKVDDPENLGFNDVYKVAKTFSNSKAGRKPDTLLVKLGKWIEVQKKGTIETAEDRALLDELIKFYNSKVD